MFRLAILMAVHNRRETTLECLGRLNSQVMPRDSLRKVFLVDDGSSDGTSEAVRRRFPKTRILKGDGSLYWNQGMRVAWDTAANAGDWDAYLWLNDDTMLLDGALRTMLETLDAQEQETGRRGIVVGSCMEPEGGSSLPETGSRKSASKGDEPVPRKEVTRRITGADLRSLISGHRPLTPDSCPPTFGKITYGGRNEHGLVQPTDKPRHIKAFNGNLVLIAREAYLQVGNLSPAYRHSFGDIDYGIRANGKGIPMWLAPGFLAECDWGGPPAFRDPSKSFLTRVQAFWGPKGPSARELIHFSRVCGKKNPLTDLLKTYLLVLAPRLASDCSRFNKTIDATCRKP